MPPRKRKAQPKLKAIAESPVKDAEEPCPEVQEPQQEAPSANQVLQKIDDEVAERVRSLLLSAHKLATNARDEGLAFLRIPKKVRDMSVAEFFNLSADEASSSTLTGVLGRLQQMTGELPAPAAPAATAPGPGVDTAMADAGPEPSKQPSEAVAAAPATEAPGTRMTRRTASRTGAAVAAAAPPTAARRTRGKKADAALAAEEPPQQPLEEKQVQGSGQAQQATEQGLPQEAQPQPEQPAQDAQPEEGVLRETVAPPQQQAAAAQAAHDRQLMPPPPLPSGRAGGGASAGAGVGAGPRRVNPGEVFFSSNGSPLALGPTSDSLAASAAVLATPAHGSAALPLATPMAGAGAGAAAGSSMFTAAANFAASAMRAMPGGASMMAGFTLMKRTVARGRTRGARTQAGAAKQEAQQDENAIMISTADGKQFLVDASSGLMNVPEQYKREVAAQLEVMQRLAAAALGRAGGA